MAAPVISELPPAPQRTDLPSDFSDKADAFVVAMTDFRTEVNDFGTWMNNQVSSIETSETNAANSASAASTSETNAANSESAASTSETNAANSASAASTSETNAGNFEAKAEKWAEEAEDVEVEPGLYSAKHYSLKAQTWDPDQYELKSNFGTAAYEDFGTSGDVLTKANGNNTWAGNNTINGITTLNGDVRVRAGTTSTPAITPNNGDHNTGVYFPSADTVGIVTGGTERVRVRSDGEVEVFSGAGLIVGGQQTYRDATTKTINGQSLGGSGDIEINAFGPSELDNKGAVANSGSQTVSCDLSSFDFFYMSMESADLSGSLTIDFTNIPNLTNEQYAWHIYILRGGRKPISFVQTINWTGGVAPELGSATGSIDLLMFYKVLNGGIRGMLVDSNTN